MTEPSLPAALCLALIALPGSAAAAESFEGWSFFLGDPHVHTGASGDGASSDLGASCDGCGAVADLAGSARAAGLDWMAVTEHANGSRMGDPRDFSVSWQAAIAAHAPDDGFVTIPAAEYHYELHGEQIGHKNAYLFADNDALQELRLADLQWDGDSKTVASCDQIWEHAATLEETWGPTLLIPHHPGFEGGMGNAWGCHRRDAARQYAPAVEVYSRHGSSMGLDGWDPLWLETDDERTVDTVLGDLDLNQRLGFMGGTDGHDSWPGEVCAPDAHIALHPYGGGLTVAMVPEGEPFDRGAIGDAIAQRRTYATTGPLVPAVIRYRSGDTELGGMGEVLEVPPNAGLEVELRVPAAWQPAVISVVLYGKSYRRRMSDMGDGSYRALLGTRDLPSYLYATLTLNGAAHYGQGGCEDGGEDQLERIWLSPTWFDAAEIDRLDTGVPWDTSTPEDTGTDGDDTGEANPSPSTGCGCSPGAPLAGIAWLASLLALLPLRRRR